ncbi:MAG TPA: hypothetical protein VKX40_06370 [Aequorivita sp.]|nr:hypothetical protein [Aequorivita sp.]
MANMKDNDKKGSQSPETVICETLTVIRNEKEAADSSANALRTLKKSKETVRAYKICCLDKAEQSYNFYGDILTSIALGNNKKATIIQKDVDDYIKKDDDIEKLIKESSALLKDLRTKIADAHNEACAMSNCVKNKLFPKTGKSTKGDNKNKIAESLKDIMEKTKNLDEKGQNAFDSIVTLAGIQTFTNTGSLKDFVTAIAEKIKIFKECIETNVKSTGEEVDTFSLEVNTITEELTQVICDKQTQNNTSKAMSHLIDFICESECDGDCLDLCKEVKNCFDGNEDGEYYQSKNRQSKDQN